MEQTNRRHAGISGVVAAGIALGMGELLAGLFDRVPSPLSAIGGVVVDNVPQGVERWAISVFGTADKSVLAIGTVVIALTIAWFAALAARKRFWPAIAVFVAFGAAGAAAGFGEPGARVIPVIAAAGVAVASGLVILWFLLQAVEGAAAPDPGGHIAADAGRRRFLALAGIGGAAALGSGVVGRALLASVPPPPEAEVSGVGIVTGVGPEHDFGLPGLTPAVVPNDEFYRIDTALAIPRIDTTDWSIRVHGRVDNELTITYDDLIAADLVEDYVTLSCVSNKVGGDLVGNARWSGVRLTGILEEAGVDRDGTQLVGRSVDGWTCGFPTELAFDGRQALVAVGMNGEVLPRRHGFPARLVVPGLYGYVSATKWLTEIEITGWDEYDAYWIPRGWAKEAPIKTQSRIDVPRSGSRIEGASVPVAGVAWAPGRGIDAVEVRLDDGPWQAAELSVPLSGNAWVQWRATLDATPGDHRIFVRATDGDGIVQTGEVMPPAPDGATGYHSIPIAATAGRS